MIIKDNFCARRIAVGGIVHETNTFASATTTLADFAGQTLCEGDAVVEQLQGSSSSIGGMLQGLKRARYEAVPLLYAAALPSGVVSREAYQTLLENLMNRLAAAKPVDGVLLALHGAMVAEDVDDCEGDLLDRVRSMVGQDCPVVSTLDMHANVSPRMVAMADALVAYNSNPHSDTLERGLEAVEVIQGSQDERWTPTSALVAPPLVLSALSTWTDQPPLKPVQDLATDIRRDHRVINVSVFGGFAYADTPFTGMSIVVTTKGNRCLARRLAYELARVAWDQRQAAADCGVPVPEAVRRALTSQKGPVILADVGDNIGGGSPGDGTLLLRELLRAAARDAVVVIADAQAVAEATAAGLGMTFDLMVGGKSDKMHGEPLLIHGTVERLTDGRYRTEGQSHFAAFYGEEVNMGRCALMRCADVRILLTERKTPPGDLAQLRSQGIVPEDQHIIVVKSPVAFRDAYAPIAASIITVDTPGLCTADLRRLGFNKMVGARFPLEMHTEWSDNKPMSAHRG